MQTLSQINGQKWIRSNEAYRSYQGLFLFERCGLVPLNHK